MPPIKRRASTKDMRVLRSNIKKEVFTVFTAYQKGVLRVYKKGGFPQFTKLIKKTVFRYYKKESVNLGYEKLVLTF